MRPDTAIVMAMLYCTVSLSWKAAMAHIIVCEVAVDDLIRGLFGGRAVIRDETLGEVYLYRTIFHQSEKV